MKQLQFWITRCTCEQFHVQLQHKTLWRRCYSEFTCAFNYISLSLHSYGGMLIYPTVRDEHYPIAKLKWSTFAIFPIANQSTLTHANPWELLPSKRNSPYNPSCSLVYHNCRGVWKQDQSQINKLNFCIKIRLLLFLNDCILLLECYFKGRL